MTNQEVFDKIVAHLRKQGKRCSNEIGCRYRYNGMMCAAGCLIPDEAYKPEMEGQYWVTLCEKFPEYSECKDLIQALQIIHDRADVKEWESKFESAAKTFGLMVPYAGL